MTYIVLEGPQGRQRVLARGLTAGEAGVFCASYVKGSDWPTKLEVVPE